MFRQAAPIAKASKLFHVSIWGHLWDDDIKSLVFVSYSGAVESLGDTSALLFTISIRTNHILGSPL
jgi:hypothetical protein